MAHTVTVLNQKFIPGLGCVTIGTISLSGTYATGGENAATSVQAKLSGYQTIDTIHFAYDDDYTAFWDRTNEKIRVFKIDSGVMTERANASSYDAGITIPFTCYSR